MILPSKLYNTVKYTVLIAIPAFSTAYMGFDAAVDGALPYENQVVKCLAVLALLLGSLTGISSLQYNASDDKYDGTIDPYLADAVTGDAALDIPEAKRKMELDESPRFHQKSVLLKVEQPKRFEGE